MGAKESRPSDRGRSDSCESPQSTTSKSKKKTTQPQSSHIVAAAIDFGTTFTGYAFSFKHDEGNVYSSRWHLPHSNTTSTKTPTVVLLKPDKTFDSFGYEAQEQYQALLEKGNEEEKKWYMFDRFKMKLYETKRLRRSVEISDLNGKTMVALDIFAMVIKYLKEKAEKEIVGRCDGLKKEEILWIITVPAIWSDSAKQFMREAANKAGVEDNYLKLVLEPEAAALYVITEKLCVVTDQDGSEVFQEFPEGQKYIVADLGGGTVDLAVHEILPDRNIRELRSANGDAYGGLLVDKAFKKFLDDVFGENVLNRLSEKHQESMLELLQEFEIKKQGFKKESANELRLRIPVVSLSEVIKEEENCSFEEKVKTVKERYDGQLNFLADKMMLKPQVVESFFKEAIDGTVKFIEEMRKDNEVEVVKKLVLVGGFSESEYIRDVLKERFNSMRIVSPQNPWLAVLKGAAMMGHKPNCITERKARFSYGLDYGRSFEEGRDPERLKVKQGDKFVCKSVFKKFITKGQILKGGEICATLAVHVPNSAVSLFAPITTSIYKSSLNDPKYTDGEDCELVGSIIIFPPLGIWPKMSLFLEGVEVGETEFTVHVLNFNTFDIFEAKLDFLKTGEEQNRVMLGGDFLRDLFVPEENP